MSNPFSRKNPSTPATNNAESRNYDFGRIPVLDIWPIVAGGSRPAKAVRGEIFPIRASVFREGYDSVAADVILIDPTGAESQRIRMDYCDGGKELHVAQVAIHQEGLWSFRIDAYSDPVSTWIRRATTKIPAGVDVDLEYQEGLLLFNRVLENSDAESSAILHHALAKLQDTASGDNERLAVLADPVLVSTLRKNVIREMTSSYGPFDVYVERKRALFGSWYEFFPRSEGAVQHPDGSWTSGTFKTASKRLDAVAAMGFDVLYLPPIHPVGFTHRKGRNNSLEAGPYDPGSPWGIGSPAGGHLSLIHI